jgi:serine/threonine protein kinase
MELVEGEPLVSQTKPVPIPIDRAVEYAMQILDALDVAHRTGIVHRDLKPANILLTKRGIKLLDFGLAKQTSAPGRPDDATLTGLTGQGEILGTPQYISPEQLQGKDADARSDLFSIGCVLYEMLSGKRAFTGQTTMSVMAAILEREPVPLDVISFRVPTTGPTTDDLSCSIRLPREPKMICGYSHSRRKACQAILNHGCEPHPTNTAGRFSLRDRWIAYQSDESGQSEIYIDTFPERHGKVQISTNGGTIARWGAVGPELFFVSPESKLMVVSLKAGGAEPSTPQELFQLDVFDPDVSPYEVARDGSGFLTIETPAHASEPLTLIVNWPALLKNQGRNKRLPP